MCRSGRPGSSGRPARTRRRPSPPPTPPAPTPTDRGSASATTDLRARRRGRSARGPAGSTARRARGTSALAPSNDTAAASGSHRGRAGEQLAAASAPATPATARHRRQCRDARRSSRSSMSPTAPRRVGGDRRRGSGRTGPRTARRSPRRTGRWRRSNAAVMPAGRAVVVELLGERQLQVELRDCRRRASTRSTGQPRQLQRRRARCSGTRASPGTAGACAGDRAGVEHLDQPLERHVRVAERGQVGLADLRRAARRRSGRRSTSVRSTRVLTNMPTRSSSAASPRPATGVPIAMSSRAATAGPAAPRARRARP